MPAKAGIHTRTQSWIIRLFRLEYPTFSDIRLIEGLQHEDWLGTAAD
jgi:hypothetical protein